MMNKKRVNLILFVLIFFAQSLSAKSDKDTTVTKYIHPRIYEIDLSDSETKASFKLNKEERTLKAELNFTKLVKDDMPQSGDKIIFYFDGSVAKDAGILSAILYDKKVNPEKKGAFIYNIVAAEQERVISENTLKKQAFKGEISFILTSDVTENLTLIIYTSIINNLKDFDKTEIKFKRVIKSVNTSQEKDNLAKAEKKNYTINEVSQEIIDDYFGSVKITYNLPIETDSLDSAETTAVAEPSIAQVSEEIPEAPEVSAEEELQKQKEIEEQEKLAKIKQIEEQELAVQQEIQKALESASKADIERYSKEYLQDYMVPEEPVITEQITVIDDEITDPDETDFSGRTLLMKAAQEGNDWKVSRLIKAGADINAKDKDGWTALMYAVRYQEGIQCVNLLIDAGADVKTKNMFDSSALSIASSFNKNPEVLKKLLSFYQSADKEVIKSLTLLLSDNHDSEYIQISKINEFLKLSVPLNSFYEGKTPLMYACLYGTSTKLIQLLLDHNSIPTLRSSEGYTAYDYAKQNKNLNYDRTYWLLNNAKQ
ncbi:MAG: ankyrin repeat domain-containing protein [Treponema sp.]|nr:ankyrin repeat domain-containing protein [Treponema sp.]